MTFYHREKNGLLLMSRCLELLLYRLPNSKNCNRNVHASAVVSFGKPLFWKTTITKKIGACTKGCISLVYPGGRMHQQHHLNKTKNETNEKSIAAGRRRRRCQRSPIASPTSTIIAATSTIMVRWSLPLEPHRHGIHLRGSANATLLRPRAHHQLWTTTMGRRFYHRHVFTGLRNDYFADDVE